MYGKNVLQYRLSYDKTPQIRQFHVREKQFFKQLTQRCKNDCAEDDLIVRTNAQSF